jgi:YHS domain-containing protein
LAELVQLRASGALASDHVDTARSFPETAVDPVCGMTVTISPDALSLEREGVTYYFCCEGCRTSFAKEARC